MRLGDPEERKESFASLEHSGAVEGGGRQGEDDVTRKDEMGQLSPSHDFSFFPLQQLKIRLFQRLF